TTASLQKKPSADPHPSTSRLDDNDNDNLSTGYGAGRAWFVLSARVFAWFTQCVLSGARFSSIQAFISVRAVSQEFAPVRQRPDCPPLILCLSL
ncbi:hypothetical protein BDZ89DRAFT_1072796, partial [Hymenopellis radicata]